MALPTLAFSGLRMIFSFYSYQMQRLRAQAHADTPTKTIHLSRFCHLHSTVCLPSNVQKTCRVPHQASCSTHMPRKNTIDMSDGDCFVPGAFHTPCERSLEFTRFPFLQFLLAHCLAYNFTWALLPRSDLDIQRPPGKNHHRHQQKPTNSHSGTDQLRVLERTCRKLQSPPPPLNRHLMRISSLLQAL